MNSCIQKNVRRSILQAAPKVVRCSRFASTVKLQSEELRVFWDDSSAQQKSQSELSADVYPYVWLRDNCQCPSCYKQSAQQRLLNTLQLDLNVKPTKAQFGEGDDALHGSRSLQVTWSDGHESSFLEGWLKPRSFNPKEDSSVESLVNEDFKQFSHWGNDFNTRVKRFNFDQIRTDKKALLGLLVALSKEGLVLLENGPDECHMSELLDSGKLITQTLGVPIKPTHYGADFFVVENKPSANNLAYTPSRLLLHADLPQVGYSPQIQALHCFAKEEPTKPETANADFVFNTFSDSFFVANQMKQQFPEYFEVLTTTKTVFHDIGTDVIDFHMRCDRPIIELDCFGEIESVNINNHVRACYTYPVPTTQLKTWYEAYQKFYDMLYENCTKIDTKQGQTFLFDNRRVLHGREGIVKHRRSLCGWYYDWDFVRSKIRCLKADLANNASH